MKTHIEVTPVVEEWGKISLPIAQIGVGTLIRDGIEVTNIFSISCLNLIAWDIEESYEEVKAMITSAEESDKVKITVKDY